MDLYAGIATVVMTQSTVAALEQQPNLALLRRRTRSRQSRVDLATGRPMQRRRFDGTSLLPLALMLGLMVTYTAWSEIGSDVGMAQVSMPAEWRSRELLASNLDRNRRSAQNVPSWERCDAEYEINKV